MRLAVLDTNVIVSAAIEPQGAPSHLIRDWVLPGQLHIVTSPAIVAEYRDVMHRPKFSRYGFPPVWLNLLLERSLHLPDDTEWPHELPDSDDARFLSAAYTAHACLVTGNMKHFPDSLRNGVEVLTPAQYVRALLSLSETPWSTRT
jgi:putative PIN family toxin of toxin-antitoxin system